MVDAANPADPDGGSLQETATPRELLSLRRDRWISATPSVEPPTASWAARAVPLLLVMTLGAFLRLFRIGAQPLWVDEATSLRFARQSLGQLWSWSMIVDPGNPPLYYSLLHGWVRLGDSDGTLRMLSALFGVLTIPLVYALGRSIRDRRLGIVGALLFAISPFQVWYSQEARAYALLTFAATLAMLGVAHLLRDLERSGKVRETGWAWLAYVLGTTIALLAHNTAVFLPIGANVLMVSWWWTHGRAPRGFLRNWLLAQLAILILWASWLPAFLQQVAHGEAYAWIPPPNLGSVLSGAYAVYGGVTRATPYPVEAAFVLALAGLGLWSWRHDRRWIAFVLILAFAAPLGELIVSVWRPIFLAQTLIWAAVPVCLTVAAGLVCLRPRVLAAALVILVVFAGLGLRSYYYLHDKEAWDQVAAYVEQGVQRGDAILFSAGFLHIPFDHYYTRPVTYAVPEVELAGDPDDLFVALEETKTRSRVWLIASPGHPQPGTDEVIAALGDAGRLVGLARFTEVDVYLFEFGGG